MLMGLTGIITLLCLIVFVIELGPNAQGGAWPFTFLALTVANGIFFGWTLQQLLTQ